MALNGMKIFVNRYSAMNFVPAHTAPTIRELTDLYDFIKSRKKLFVLTGAGVSTESGIPDYRSDIIGRYAKHEPVRYQIFVQNPMARKHFWARNYTAWSFFSKFSPNINHTILNDWEQEDRIHWLVTQNVDMLHAKAGNERLTEMHGSAKNVVCLTCDYITPRKLFQSVLHESNPDWDYESIDIRPDGDMNIPNHLTKAFNVPLCPKCNGTLKPHVVFFGENIPKPRSSFIRDKLSESDGMLVLGSSLHVHSAYRLITDSFSSQKPVAIVNIGNTRADDMASLRVTSSCSIVLKGVQNLFNESAVS